MTDILLGNVLDFAIRASVVLLLAWAATAVMRRASAATRHLIWASAIAGVLVLPLVATVIPAWNVPVLWNVPVPSTTPRVAPVTAQDAPLAMAPHDIPASHTPAADVSGEPAPSDVPTGQAAVDVDVASASPLRLTPARAFVFAWLALALALLARLAVANARVGAWQRSARPVEDGRWLSLLRRLTRQYGIVRPVMLLESDDTDVPVTWGVVYPVVLLPATSNDWDEEQATSVLTHELAHVKRFDALTQLLAQLALALLWFHPLVWVAVRRMRLEREHACDDFVLVAGARASRYADDLLSFARRMGRTAVPSAAALAMARRSELEGRLLAILDPATKRTVVRRARVALLMLGVAALVVPLAAFRPALVEPDVVVLAAPVITGSPVASPVEAHAPVIAAVDVPAVVAGEPAPSSSLPVYPPPSVSLLASGRVSRALVRALPDTEPPRLVDVQTLVDVTRHAKKLTSDYEKGQLLASIAKRYVPSDSLREAYLETVFTMTSDYERSKALMALLDRDSIPVSSTARVLRSAALMTSDMNRGQVLRRISPATFADSAVQRAFLDVVVAMTNDTEKGAAISNLVKGAPMTPPMQLALLRATGAITSNTEKAKVLVAFVERQGIADSTVRRAFLRTAEGLTSDSEYRRVMMAVMR